MDARDTRIIEVANVIVDREVSIIAHIMSVLISVNKHFTTNRPFPLGAKDMQLA